MVARKDSCPYDSGKKYKKCHSQEQTQNLIGIVERELKVITPRFIDEGMEIKHVEEMIQRDKRWFTALEETFPAHLISDLSFESYAYVENRDLWIEFIKCEIKNNHRTQITKALEGWLHPQWILAKVRGLA